MDLRDEFDKNKKRLVITRELMENARKRIEISAELEKELDNVKLQRRMKKLDLESKVLKQQEKDFG